VLEFQQRVVEEKTALAKKIESLRAFMYTSDVYKMLPQDEQCRLMMQYNIMRLYEKILSDRIDNFYRT
jgi:hypothetical protein